MLEEKIEMQASVMNRGLAILSSSFNPLIGAFAVNEMQPLINEWQAAEEAIDAKYKAKFETARKPDGERNG
jgi:hypothetical protein